MRWELRAPPGQAGGFCPFAPLTWIAWWWALWLFPYRCGPLPPPANSAGDDPPDGKVVSVDFRSRRVVGRRQGSRCRSRPWPG